MERMGGVGCKWQIRYIQLAVCAGGKRVLLFDKLSRRPYQKILSHRTRWRTLVYSYVAMCAGMQRMCHRSLRQIFLSSTAPNVSQLYVIVSHVAAMN